MQEQNGRADVYFIYECLYKNEGEGIPFPLIGIIDVCEDKEHWGKFWTRITDFKNDYLCHKGYYGDLIMVLAYTIFGYGNWSNNDRMRKGLKSIRFKQLKTNQAEGLKIER